MYISVASWAYVRGMLIKAVWLQKVNSVAANLTTVGQTKGTLSRTEKDASARTEQSVYQSVSVRLISALLRIDRSTTEYILQAAEFLFPLSRRHMMSGRITVSGTVFSCTFFFFSGLIHYRKKIWTYLSFSEISTFNSYHASFSDHRT